MTTGATTYQNTVIYHKKSDDTWEKIYNLYSTPALGQPDPTNIDVSDLESEMIQNIAGIGDIGTLTFNFWAMPKGVTNSNQDILDNCGDNEEFKVLVPRQNVVFYLMGDARSRLGEASVNGAATLVLSMTCKSMVKDTIDTTYTVTYNSNGGTGTAITDSNSPYELGEDVTVLAATGLTKTGSRFARWNTQTDGLGSNYEPGQSFQIYADTTLYAVWTPEE